MSVDADELKPNISGFRELDVATHTTQTLIGGILKSTWRDHYSLISLADLMIDNEYRFQNIPAERAASSTVVPSGTVTGILSIVR